MLDMCQLQPSFPFRSHPHTTTAALLCSCCCVPQDAPKYARIKELLYLQQVIKDARNSFKESVGEGGADVIDAD